MFKIFLCVVLLSLGLFACRSSYNIVRKYSAEKLRQDYDFMEAVLEKKHPSIYWYTPKDSMDATFRHYRAAIADSLNEVQFVWQILAPTLSRIRCGHTSLEMSKKFSNEIYRAWLPSFPLFIRFWSDSMAVIGSLTKNDSIFKRGTIIKEINGENSEQILVHMFKYLPIDGFATNLNYNRLSGNFPYYQRNIYGLHKSYLVTYLDSAGKEKLVNVPLFIPQKDTTKQAQRQKQKEHELTRDQKEKEYRSLLIDSVSHAAVMEVNMFYKGHLRSFFRKSFKTMRQQNQQNLILDIRRNGGGRVGLCTLLAKYISLEKFRVADSVFAKSRTIAPFGWRANKGFFNTLQLFFSTHKMSDGYYHMRYFERKNFHPKKKNHFHGNVYVLTNGATFSAAAMFANIVKGQKNVWIVGEETGGGWYGNNGILIPDIKLPNTKVRFRLPLFRVIQYHHPNVKGSGVVPDIVVPPTRSGLIKRRDEKMDVVRKIILNQHWPDSKF